MTNGLVVLLYSDLDSDSASAILFASNVDTFAVINQHYYDGISYDGETGWAAATIHDSNLLLKDLPTDTTKPKTYLSSLGSQIDPSQPGKVVVTLEDTAKFQLGGNSGATMM